MTCGEIIMFIILILQIHSYVKLNILSFYFLYFYLAIYLGDRISLCSPVGLFFWLSPEIRSVPHHTRLKPDILNHLDPPASLQRVLLRTQQYQVLLKCWLVNLTKCPIIIQYNLQNRFECFLLYFSDIFIFLLFVLSCVIAL